MFRTTSEKNCRTCIKGARLLQGSKLRGKMFKKSRFFHHHGGGAGPHFFKITFRGSSRSRNLLNQIPPNFRSVLSMFQTTCKKFFSSRGSVIQPLRGARNRQNPPKIDDFHRFFSRSPMIIFFTSLYFRKPRSRKLLEVIPPNFLSVSSMFRRTSKKFCMP